MGPIGFRPSRLRRRLAPSTAGTSRRLRRLVQLCAVPRSVQKTKSSGAVCLLRSFQAASSSRRAGVRSTTLRPALVFDLPTVNVARSRSTECHLSSSASPILSPDPASVARIGRPRSREQRFGSLEQIHELLDLDPRTVRLRRLQPATAAGRRVTRDDLVLDGLREDLAEPSDRLVDAGVGQPALTERVAVRLRTKAGRLDPFALTHFPFL